MIGFKQCMGILCKRYQKNQFVVCFNNWRGFETLFALLSGTFLRFRNWFQSTNSSYCNGFKIYLKEIYYRKNTCKLRTKLFMSEQFKMNTLNLLKAVYSSNLKFLSNLLERN